MNMTIIFPAWTYPVFLAREKTK